MTPEHPTDPVPYTRWQLLLKRAGNYLPWRKSEEGSIKAHAGPIIDLFASIVMRDEQMSETDASSALDFLRYSFPDIEHAWLALHFKRATQSIHPVSQVAVIAGRKKSLPERMSMALEVLSLLKNARDQRAIESLFDEVTAGLDLPNVASELRALLDDPLAEPPAPITSVRFNSSTNSEVILEDVDRNHEFRVFYCGDLMLVMNDGEIPLKVRGKTLPPKSLIPLYSGQVISLESGPVAYSDLRFFVNAKKTGQKSTFFLLLENDSLILQRNKIRPSLLRLTFGLSMEVELLKKANAFIDGQKLELNTPVTSTYHSRLEVNGIGPFVLAQLQSRTEDIGKRFEVNPGQRIVRVSNDPSKIGPGDLLISRGFASILLFEVRFSHSSQTGILIPLEVSEPLMVNGRVVKGPILLQNGDLIRINSNQSLRCNFEDGVLDEEHNVIHELKVDGLSHEFSKDNKVLDNIDFHVRRGEMVCILGPSGSGKSTLLSCLAGHLKPTYGKIRYNGLSLYSWHAKLVPLIAHIPREDILNPYLSVKEHLGQAITIRRPKLGFRDRRRRIHTLLKYLGLSHLAERRVGASTDKHLSDGERTRLNLGLDMSGLADVFLMDEPISGLSSRDSENVIDTLENISREKIVIATLHRPSAHLLNRFQKVLLLDHGGKLAFWGTPAHMLRYFKDAEKEMGLDISLDNKSAGGADFVFEALESPGIYNEASSKPSSFWQERFEDYRFNKTSLNEQATLTRSESGINIPDIAKRGFVEHWRLFRVWVIRTLVTRIRSKVNLYTALIEGPVLAFLIAFPLRSVIDHEYVFSKALHVNAYLFLSTVVAMFFGLMNGATEIIRDRSLLKRERNSQIFFSGYVGAKGLVLSLVSATQCALYLAIGNAILGIHELFLPFLLVMLLTSLVGLAASLLVSLVCKTERAALNMVPLLLVPQILMAGAVLPFGEMNHFVNIPPRHEESTGKLKPGRVPYFSELCPLRYSYESLIVLQATRNPYDYNRRILQDKVNLLKSKTAPLDKKEINELKLTLQALTAIASLEAINAKEADYGLRRLREYALRGDPELFLNFIDRFQEQNNKPEEEPHTLSAFFVNERINNLFDYAEALRVSRELEERAEIFLSARKPIPLTRNDTDRDDPSYSADKNTIPTPLYNNLHLLLMALLALFVCRGILKHKLEKPKS